MACVSERGSILSESEADQEYLQELKKRTVPGNPTVKWEEKDAEDKEQIISRIKEEKRCNLFLVGRSPPVGQLMSKTDSPELGPVGSFLVSPEFSSTTTSVIVIQQYDPSAEHKVVEEVEGIQDVPDTPAPNKLASIQSTK